MTTTRFPQPPTASSMAAWPKAGVPKPHLETLLEAGLPIEAIQGTQSPQLQQGSYPLFNTPIVQRRSPPLRPAHPSANALLTDTRLTVRPTDRNDVASGVLLQPGQEFQINASGSIWGGALFDPWNSPAGQTRLIDDARWPLHTGLDSEQARAFCLLGRLNGYFFVGTHLPRMRFVYHEPRELFLRINDAGLGDGSGAFEVRVRVWGQQSAPPPARHEILRDGGTLLTSDAVDRIEVTVMANAVPPDTVEFQLHTPPEMTWRKEIVIRESPATGRGAWTIYTQDTRHEDQNGLYTNQLAGGSLTFRKAKFLGIMSDVRALDLSSAQGGSRITFKWEKDS